MFFGRLDNDRAICMDVRSFPWFNRGSYTANQISKLQAVGRELLAGNAAYKMCTNITVHEVNGVNRSTAIKEAGVRRGQPQ